MKNMDHRSDKASLIPFTSSGRGENSSIIRHFSLRRVLFYLAIVGTLYCFVIFYSWHTLNNAESNTSFSRDYDDVGCNGYPLDERIATNQRILRSVRAELVESSKKLDEVTAQYEYLTREIKSKEDELDGIKSEIENAIRVLKDWNDRRNVHVSLPLRPLFSHDLSSPVEVKRQFHSLEDAVDFRRCSITAFLRAFVYPIESTNQMVVNYYRTLKSSRWNVEDANTACLFINIVDGSVDESKMEHWRVNGRNHIIVNVGSYISTSDSGFIIIQNGGESEAEMKRSTPLSIPSFLHIPSTFDWFSIPPLLPFQRKFLIFSAFSSPHISLIDLESLKSSAAQSEDTVFVVSCSDEKSEVCTDVEARTSSMKSSIFTILVPSPSFYQDLYNCLKSGSIPVVLSMNVELPFQDCIDWNLVLLRLPLSRFPEIHFIIRSISLNDGIEMKRRGRIVMEHYLGSIEALSSTLLSCLSNRLRLPSLPSLVVSANPLFNNSFTPPILTPVNLPPFDDEYLGPLEAPYPSASFRHNFTSLQLYSSQLWSSGIGGFSSPEFIPFDVDAPSDTEFDPDDNLGFRPIQPGSGKEFSQAIGGNRQREQFTIVMLTYNRDVVLASSLERLHKMPFLNKIVIIWNNIGRVPPLSWPRLHVPVEFIKVSSNSLNNRFIPWDRIETEAVLSLDDDIDLRQHEIVFAFRVWRENRNRIVGFPARFHARFDSQMYYNSNHTCQLSMILTGAAFINKAYFHSYSYSMPSAIREHVDNVTNCEDIAMNFLVSHLTRQPPIKTTSKWTLRCPTCSETLSQDESHFSERHNCIRYFTKVYGYNPLKFSQFRADSVLFKTRVPANAQKCFKYV